MERFHWMVRVQAGCNVARKSLRGTGSRNQPEILDPTSIVDVLEGEGRNGRQWRATMERRTEDLYTREVTSRGGDGASPPVAD
jgi:hypothetical protein